MDQRGSTGRRARVKARSGEFLDLRLRQPVQQDPGGTVPLHLGQPGPERMTLVQFIRPVGGDHQDRRLGQPVNKVAGKIQGGGVGPVEVLQDHNDRLAAPAKPVKQGPRHLAHVPLAAGCSQGRRQLGGVPSQAAPESGGNLQPWPVRGRLPFSRAPPNRPQAVAGLLLDVLYQRALPHTGLAADEDHASPAGGGGLYPCLKLCPHRTPAHEWQREHHARACLLPRRSA